MNKITIIEEISRSVKVNNSEDAKRKYDIECIARVEKNKVMSIDSLMVKLGDRQIANGTAYRNGMNNDNFNFNLNFMGDADNSMKVISAEVENFANEVNTFIENGKEDNV